MAAEALKWISDLLRSRGVSFQICGGLAAIGHGATRSLHDIDLFVPGASFCEVVEAGSEFITKPARRYVEYQWDIKYVQFVVAGTKVEVGSAFEAKVFGAQKNRWVRLNIDFTDYQLAELFGQTVPVMSKANLIRYKKILDREVDREDIRAIE